MQFKAVSAAHRSTPDCPGETRLAEAARFIRCHAIASIYHAGSGHPGGALSCADLLACLYGAELNVWPDAVERSRARPLCPVQGPCRARALCRRAPITASAIAKAALSLRKLNSPFQGHPHVLDLPWVETSTGSLGQGFSVALGMAMGLKLQKIRARVYTMLGDGELQEGEVWEAAMCARRITSSTISAPSSTTTSCRATIATTRSCGWSRWPRNGAPSAGPWSRSTATTFREILSTSAPRRRHARAPVGHHRPHHQGQGRALHGKHPRLARQRETDARSRPKRRWRRWARAANEIKELLDV